MQENHFGTWLQICVGSAWTENSVSLLGRSSLSRPSLEDEWPGSNSLCSCLYLHIFIEQIQLLLWKLFHNLAWILALFSIGQIASHCSSFCGFNKGDQNSMEGNPNYMDHNNRTPSGTGSVCTGAPLTCMYFKVPQIVPTWRIKNIQFSYERLLF